jgi:hypothetical protein
VQPPHLPHGPAHTPNTPSALVPGFEDLPSKQSYSPGKTLGCHVPQPPILPTQGDYTSTQLAGVFCHENKNGIMQQIVRPKTVNIIEKTMQPFIAEGVCRRITMNQKKTVVLVGFLPFGNIFKFPPQMITKHVRARSTL